MCDRRLGGGGGVTSGVALAGDAEGGGADAGRGNGGQAAAALEQQRVVHGGAAQRPHAGPVQHINAAAARGVGDDDLDAVAVGAAQPVAAQQGGGKRCGDATADERHRMVGVDLRMRGFFTRPGLPSTNQSNVTVGPAYHTGEGRSVEPRFSALLRSRLPKGPPVPE